MIFLFLRTQIKIGYCDNSGKRDLSIYSIADFSWKCWVLLSKDVSSTGSQYRFIESDYENQVVLLNLFNQNKYVIFKLERTSGKLIKDTFRFGGYDISNSTIISVNDKIVFTGKIKSIQFEIGVISLGSKDRDIMFLGSTASNTVFWISKVSTKETRLPFGMTTPARIEAIVSFKTSK